MCGEWININFRARIGGTGDCSEMQKLSCGSSPKFLVTNNDMMTRNFMHCPIIQAKEMTQHSRC